jgi:hypothetical protein
MTSISSSTTPAIGWLASSTSGDALRERLLQASGNSTAAVSASSVSTEDAASVIVRTQQSQAAAAAADYASGVSKSMPFALTVTPVASQEDINRKIFGDGPAWADETAANDAVSRLIARNATTAYSGNGVLASQWKGLGSALLSQLATSATDGPFSYEQSRLKSVYSAQPLESQFGSLKTGAATVALQIKTRSGQTVELQIVVNTKIGSGSVLYGQGIHVSASSTGKLSDAERKALAALSDGLEQALAGLGQQDASASQLDLSGLMNFDRSVFSSLNLDVRNPYVHVGPESTTWMAPTQSLALHLGEKENTLAWKGVTDKSQPGKLSEINMRVDAQALLPASGSQRQQAIAQYLQQIDAAAARSHADGNDDLVQMFKSSFAQMHGITSDEATAASKALTAWGLTDKVSPLLSGLADFEASFSGSYFKTRDGVRTEQGDVSYRIGQRTEMKTSPAAQRVAITQTQNEQLQAKYLQGRNGGMLDLVNGNYDIYEIDDDNTTTTSIVADTEKGLLLSAERHVQKNRMQTWKMLVQDLVKDERETPEKQDDTQSLL